MMYRRLLISCVLLSVVCAAAFCFQKAPASLKTAGKPDHRRVVLLDAGHETFRKPKIKGNIA